MPSSSADGIRWDLSDLYQGVDDPEIAKDLERAAERARHFEATYRGTIATQTGPSASHLKKAMEEFEPLSEQMDKPLVFAHLLHAACTDDPAIGALLARTREARTAINRHLIFFELEWVQLADEPARRDRATGDHSTEPWPAVFSAVTNRVTASGRPRDADCQRSVRDDVT